MYNTATVCTIAMYNTATVCTIAMYNTATVSTIITECSVYCNCFTIIAECILQLFVLLRSVLPLPRPCNCTFKLDPIHLILVLHCNIRYCTNYTLDKVEITNCIIG